MAKLVAAAYGEALYKAALEGSGKTDAQGKTAPQSAIDLLVRDVVDLCTVLDDNPEFDKFMKHPGIPRHDKLEMIDRVFRGHISDDIAGLMDTVIMKGRYGYLRDIFTYFLNKIKEERKIGIVFVTTAVSMDETQKAQVRERILKTAGYRDLEIHYQVDEGIIGGMVIRIKDRVVDSSVRSKLENMTKQLLQIRLG